MDVFHIKCARCSMCCAGHWTRLVAPELWTKFLSRAMKRANETICFANTHKGSTFGNDYTYAEIVPALFG